MSYKDILKKKANEWGCPDMLNDVKDNIPKIPFSSPLLNWATYGGVPRGRVVEFHGEEGGGKAQPLYSKVLTVNGFVEMRDIKIGDQVFDRHGMICTVDGIYPQPSQKIYEITLQDRCTIRVAENHLNTVWRYDYYTKQREEAVLTTQELIDTFHNSNGSSRYSKWRIDIPSVDWEEKPVPVDPYLLGAFLGDGGLTNKGMCEFTNGEADIVSKLDNILRRDWGCYLKQSPSDPFQWRVQNIEKWYPLTIQFESKQFSTIDNFRNYLAENGFPKIDQATIKRISAGLESNVLKKYPKLKGIKILQNKPSGIKRLYDTLDNLGVCCKSVDKHIPPEYLLNSKQIRLELLRGLFDTDGYSNNIKSGIGQDWTTASRQLSKDFAFLVRSLGIRDTVCKSHPHFNGKEFVAWTHYLKAPNEIRIFSSRKHEDRFRPREWAPMNRIDNIEYVGEDICQCLHVTSSDHTYISDNFIPTHNTTTALDISRNAIEIFKQEYEAKVQEYRDFVVNGKKEYAGPLEDLLDQGPKAVVYWDLEHSFDWAWAATVGLHRGDIDVVPPPDIAAEQICQAIQDTIVTGEIGLIVLDSIPSLVTAAELDKKYGERTVSSLAGLMTTFMRKITPLCSKHDCTLLMVNQTRDNLDNPYVIQTPGGRAIKFYCTLRMYFKKGAQLDFAGNEVPNNVENPAGYKINVKIVKQKGAPFDRKVASYFLMSQTGIRPDFDYAKLAIEKYGIIQKKGAWFSMCDPLTGEILDDEEGKPIKVNGVLKVYDYLKEHPDYYEKIKVYITADINGEEVNMDDVVPEDIEYKLEENDEPEEA